MTTEIFTFQEYSGPSIPSLPFPIFYRKAENKMPDDFPEIYRKNVKVFERDLEKRKIILDTFLANGFTLVADHLTFTFPPPPQDPKDPTPKDPNELPKPIIVKEYDRLVFSC